jgi:hypothetical protein
MTTPAELRKDRQQLLAMRLELQANRILLDGLLDCYGTFRFTGGVVPREAWGLVAMTSYLECPFAADRISIAAAERYRHLAGAIMDLGHTITAGARPRTLHCRFDIADAFDRDSTEIRALGSTLESAITKIVEEPEPSPRLPDTESVESGFPTHGVLATATGGDP